MNPPDAEPSSRPRSARTPTRRQARRQAQRARRKARFQRGAWIAAGVAIAVVVALFLTDTIRLRLGAEPGPALAASATTKSARFNPPVTVPTSTTHCRTPLTPAAPLRVWAAGDSLAWSIATGVGKYLSSTGVAAENFESHVSSGLGNAGFFDWPKRAAVELARLNPEIVIFSIGTNDWVVPTGPAPSTTSTTTGAVTTTTTAAAGSWQAKYAALVEQMVELLVGDGSRTVYWVGPPVLGDPPKESGAVQIAEVTKQVLSRHSTVIYVDSHALTVDTAGKYTPYVQKADGKKVLIRTDDGVHYTLDGADYLGSVLYDTIDRQCNLDSQSVAGAKIPVVETQGSSGTGTSATTTVTTAPTTSSTTKSSVPTSTTTAPSSTTSTPSSTTTTKAGTPPTP